MPNPHLSRRGLLTASAAVGAAAVATQVLPSAFADAHASNRYRWRNVEIVGGGFVPGIVFNQAEPNLIYARTDIGGAYRWDKWHQRWIPLLDWVGWDDWGHSGVASLATDARDPDRVYAAVGTYTNDWDPNNGAILRSRDRGATWKAKPAAVQARREHARPGYGRAPRHRSQPQQHPVPRGSERQWPVAQR